MVYATTTGIEIDTYAIMMWFLFRPIREQVRASTAQPCIPCIIIQDKDELVFVDLWDLKLPTAVVRTGPRELIAG